MNRRLFTAAVLFAAVPLFAEQAATPAVAPSQQQKIVATINGEIITKDKLDQLWNRIGSQMRTQYEKNGGKGAFLDNYIRKRLLIQEAIKRGFDKRPDIQADMEASKDSVLFDRYVRDVVSEHIVTEKETRDYYDANLSQFATPESVKVRHIVITAADAGPRQKSKQEALEQLQKIAAELKAIRFVQGTNPEIVQRTIVSKFAEAAAKYSEDGVAEIGGDLGWTERGMLDKSFEDAAFNLPVATVSGIVETGFGYHLILVEARRPAGTEPYETSRASIREFLMTQHAPEVMETVNKLTNNLRNESKIGIFPENLN
jgi:parvulin-like peptidyl-prolyl isomerase